MYIDYSAIFAKEF